MHSQFKLSGVHSATSRASVLLSLMGQWGAIACSGSVAVAVRSISEVMQGQVHTNEVYSLYIL